MLKELIKEYNTSLDNISCIQDTHIVFENKDKICDILAITSDEEIVKITNKLRSELMSILATNNYI